jgi:hypothetical protein
MKKAPDYVTISNIFIVVLLAVSIITETVKIGWPILQFLWIVVALIVLDTIKIKRISTISFVVTLIYFIHCLFSNYSHIICWTVIPLCLFLYNSQVKRIIDDLSERSNSKDYMKPTNIDFGFLVNIIFCCCISAICFYNTKFDTSFMEDVSSYQSGLFILIVFIIFYVYFTWSELSKEYDSYNNAFVDYIHKNHDKYKDIKLNNMRKHAEAEHEKEAER